MGLYRLQNTLPNSRGVRDGHELIEDIVCVPEMKMRSDHMTPKYVYDIPFEVSILDRSAWINNEPEFLSGSLVWYTDGSKTEEGTGAGIHGLGPRKDLFYPLGGFPTVFQAETYAILQCAWENNRRAYNKKRICICSDSQAVLKALMSQKVVSRLVWECQNELRSLADRNVVRLFWVPGHKGIHGNERADELARQASATPYIGPEPALGVPKCTAREAVKRWIKN